VEAQNIGTLRNRINELGVAEPIIQRRASRIVVQLPGVQDTALAKKILGATATLEYRAVVGDGATNAYEAARSGRVPPDARLYYAAMSASTGQPVPVLLKRRVIASGDQLVDARSGFDPQDGSPMVSVRLNNVGGQRMLDFTTENVGRGMAVVFIERVPEIRIVDGEEVRTFKETAEVISVANIRGVFGKNFQTTGLDSSRKPRAGAAAARRLAGGAGRHRRGAGDRSRRWARTTSTPAARDRARLRAGLHLDDHLLQAVRRDLGGRAVHQPADAGCRAERSSTPR
jgi:preprotein translocase subunit SecD